MKSKTLKIMLFTGVMLIVLTAVHFSTGLFTPYNYFTANYDILNEKYRLLYCGELKPTDRIAKVVSKEFGFSYERVENCTVSIATVNGIHIYNDLVTRELDKKYGSDWYFDFQDKVDSLYMESRVDSVR